MAMATEAPKDRFRLSMLVYDTRYRAVTIQVIVLVLVLMGLSWLFNNTVQNLALKDRDFNFGFLWNRAGYDIGQALIPYTNNDPHFRALLVGLVNTLVLAFFACLGATVLGVVAGVLRLSRNWLVARLMTVYVEVFRNIPLLLWILLTYVFLTETRPQPRDFRGEDPAATMWLDGSMVVTNRATNIPGPLFENGLGSVPALGLNVSLNFLAILAVVAASIWANRIVLRRARRIQEDTGRRPTTWWQSLLILLGPVTALLWALGFHLEYPELRGFNFAGGIALDHAFTAMFVALSIYTGAFIAEIVRAGIQAISRGQTEAAYALGLRPGWTTRLIILPQALRVIIPPLISQYLNITKNTSLGIAVGYLDLRGTLGGITLNQTGRELESMLLMMAIYLTISLIISAVINVYNSRIQLKER